MSALTFYNCSQHDNQFSLCYNLSICKYTRDSKCICNEEVSDSTDNAKCTCKDGFKPTEKYDKCYPICKAGYEPFGTSCQMCGFGKWSKEGDSDCKTCTDPTPVSNINHTGCISSTECAQIQNAEEVVQTCRCKGDYVPTEDSSQCLNKCPAGKQMGTNSKCQSCPDGTASLSVGSLCSACPADQVVSFMKDACVAPTECGEGLVTVNVQCSCPAGTYRNNDECTSCGVGEASADGATKCTRCYWDKRETPYASIDRKQCITKEQCEQIIDAQADSIQDQCKCKTHGHKLDETGTKCVNPCLAGTYLNGDQGCIACDPGKYSQNGAAQCTTCTDPKAVSNPGHTGCMTPDECAQAGGTLPSDGTHCSCGSAGFQPTTDGTACAECADGRVISTSNSCTVCSGGTVANLQHSECVKADSCGSSASAVDGQCYCAAGYQRNKDRSGCEACPAGSVSDATSNTCTECPSGSEAPNTARTACLCRSGYGAVSSGACERCPEGYFSAYDPNGESKDSCRRCPDGQHPNEERTACVDSATPVNSTTMAVAIAVPVVVVLVVIIVATTVILTKKKKNRLVRYDRVSHKSQVVDEASNANML